MKSTHNLSANLTKTLLIILGIVVAVLLTFNSGMIGETSALTGGFRFFTTEAEATTSVDRIEQMKQMISMGRDLYQEVSQLLESR